MTFDSFAENYFDSLSSNKITEAMKYAFIGGKHFRPELIFSIVKGFRISESEAYDASLALEMIHTYSLIHDDLPCMDDDDYRRGKPSVHVAYGEDIAVLTGDALLTEAFNVISKSSYSNELKNKIVSVLATQAGINGMVYGQLLDLMHENDDKIDQMTLDLIQDYKTGALFKAALFIGMYISGDDKNIEFYDKLAISIGRIFQIQDDLFDIIKSREELGKSQSDLANHKATIFSLYTIDEIQDRLKKEFDKIYAFVNGQSFDTSYLINVLKRMETR